MPTVVVPGTEKDAISDLINRARLNSKDPQMRDSIMAEASGYGISSDLLLILEQMQKAFEDEAKRKSQEAIDNATIAVSAKALSNNDLSMKSEKDGLLAVLTSALKGVNEGIKVAFLESRSNLVDTLQTRSVQENETLDKVVSGEHIREKDITRMKSLVKDPTIVKQSASVVDNTRAVVQDILTHPETKQVQKYKDAHADQQAKINIINNDPVVLKAARIQGMGFREAVYKAELMEVSKKTLKKVETKEQKFDLKAMHEAAQMEKSLLEQEKSAQVAVAPKKKFTELIQEQSTNKGHPLPPRSSKS